MSGTAHADLRAGLRLVLPPQWLVTVNDDPEDSGGGLTTAASPPGTVEVRPVDDDWGPTLDEVFEEAGRAPDDPRPAVPQGEPPEERLVHPPPGSYYHDPAESTDPEAWVTKMLDHRRVYVGLWEGAVEGVPPEGEDLLDDAEEMANRFMDGFQGFVPDSIQGVDHFVRKVTVSGRPAAAIWYRFMADESGETAAYLRLLLVDLPDGRCPYVLGMAPTDAYRRLIDDCLDSVEVIGPGTAR
jgi:hypothetical protein